MYKNEKGVNVAAGSITKVVLTPHNSEVIRIQFSFGLRCGRRTWSIAESSILHNVTPRTSSILITCLQLFAQNIFIILFNFPMWADTNTSSHINTELNLKCDPWRDESTTRNLTKKNWKMNAKNDEFGKCRTNRNFVKKYVSSTSPIHHQILYGRRNN